MKSLDGIFQGIMIISMILCFFSLSSSMSANIFDQAKEISIMLSLGFTRANVFRLFVYEALILVLSSSLCGFAIGLSIGSIMTVQQAMLQSSPWHLEAPWFQLRLMLFTSIICAVASTWGSARRILKLSIPDISRLIS